MGDNNRWSIGNILLGAIGLIIPHGSKLLELGSGAGTGKLAEMFEMTSIEHQTQWLDKYNTRYIHAPIVDGWYREQNIKDQLSSGYAGILVDGPNGSENRARFVDHMDLFDLSVWIFFDDIHRETEHNAFIRMVDILGRAYGEYHDEEKAFGIVVAKGELREFERMALELGLRNYVNKREVE